MSQPQHAHSDRDATWSDQQVMFALAERGLSAAGTKQDQLKRLAASDQLLHLFKSQSLSRRSQVNMYPSLRFVACLVLILIVVFVQNRICVNGLARVAEWLLQSADDSERRNEWLYRYYLHIWPLWSRYAPWVHLVASVYWNAATFKTLSEAGSTVPQSLKVLPAAFLMVIIPCPISSLQKPLRWIPVQDELKLLRCQGWEPAYFPTLSRAVVRHNSGSQFPPVALPADAASDDVHSSSDLILRSPAVSTKPGPIDAIIKAVSDEDCAEKATLSDNVYHEYRKVLCSLQTQIHTTTHLCRQHLDNVPDSPSSSSASEDLEHLGSHWERKLDAAKAQCNTAVSETDLDAFFNLEEEKKPQDITTMMAVLSYASERNHSQLVDLHRISAKLRQTLQSESQRASETLRLRHEIEQLTVSRDRVAEQKRGDELENERLQREVATLEVNRDDAAQREHQHDIENQRLQREVQQLTVNRDQVADRVLQAEQDLTELREASERASHAAGQTVRELEQKIQHDARSIAALSDELEMQNLTLNTIRRGINEMTQSYDRLRRIALIRFEEGEEQAVHLSDKEIGVVLVQNHGGVRNGKREPLKFRFERAVAVRTSYALVPLIWDIESLIWEPRFGRNVAIILDGQSGSGKTHCMFDADYNILLTAARSLNMFTSPGYFTRPRGVDSSTTHQDYERTVRTFYSVMEVYREEAYDLCEAPVAPDSNDYAKVRLPLLQDYQRRREWTSPEQLVDLVKQACARRHVERTAKNDRSSRGHVVITLVAQQTTPRDVKAFHITLVDLAGSERQPDHVTGQANTSSSSSSFSGLDPDTRYINKSRSTFRTYLSNAGVPGDSLTKIINSSLTRESRVMFISCCRPTGADRDATVDTLNFSESLVLSSPRRPISAS